MPTKIELNQVDFSDEASRTGFYVATLDAAGFVAASGAANTIRTAIEAISLCNEKSLTASVVLHSANGAAPTDVHAQRELAVKVFYVDAVTGDKHNLTIPGPDLTALTLAGDNVTLADGGVMAALVTALEANAKSKLGNAIVVKSARVVGRNN